MVNDRSEALTEHPRQDDMKKIIMTVMFDRLHFLWGVYIHLSLYTS